MRLLIQDGDARFDADGLDLASDAADKIEASVSLGQLLKDQLQGFWIHRELKLIVTDESRLLLFGLDLSAIGAPAIRQRA